MSNNIVESIDETGKVKKMPVRWIKCAAAVVIIITGALMMSLLTVNTKKSEPVIANHVQIPNPTAKIHNVNYNIRTQRSDNGLCTNCHFDHIVQYLFYTYKKSKRKR